MKRLMNYVSFTKNEVKVIVFVISVLTAGFAIKYFDQVVLNDSDAYDFSKYDKEFRDRSLGGKRSQSGDWERGSLAASDAGDDSLIRKLEQEEAASEDSGNNYFENLQAEIVNINTASLEMLVDLPGIGESTALKIIEYRSSKGKFKKTEELMNIKGIGKKKFESIKKHIKAE